MADQANKIRASMQLAPSVGALTAPTSHAPSFANAFRLPGATASAKASTTPLSKTRSFADTFLTSRASATAKAPTASAAKTSTTAEEPTITTDVDDVATTTAYADVIPAEVAAGRSSAQPTAHQEHS
ncbi:MAG: hypothetical protein K2Q25_13910 [Mycobacteriaceae bacterium]|nr:hypothetical protein [Mycobacteriaceae bacterium]